MSLEIINGPQSLANVKSKTTLRLTGRIFRLSSSTTKALQEDSKHFERKEACCAVKAFSFDHEGDSYGVEEHILDGPFAYRGGRSCHQQR